MWQTALANDRCPKKSDHCRTIDTFLRGYYGEAGAPHVLRYLEIMHESGVNLFSRPCARLQVTCVRMVT